MKSEEAYNTWKDKKSQIDIRENFTDKVMTRMYQYEQHKSKSFFDMQRLVEFVSAHPFAKVGLVTASAAAGFLRLAFVVWPFLWA